MERLTRLKSGLKGDDYRPKKDQNGLLNHQQQAGLNCWDKIQEHDHQSSCRSGAPNRIWPALIFSFIHVVVFLMFRVSKMSYEELKYSETNKSDLLPTVLGWEVLKSMKYGSSPHWNSSAPSSQSFWPSHSQTLEMQFPPGHAKWPSSHFCPWETGTNKHGKSSSRY